MVFETILFTGFSTAARLDYSRCALTDDCRTCVRLVGNFALCCEDMKLSTILSTVLIVLVALWLIGLVANIAGALIHVLLIGALIVLVYNFLAGR